MVHDGELDMDSIKPLLGTIKFHDVPEVMDARQLAEWDGDALRDKLAQLPSLLDHTFFEDDDRSMSMMSVKYKTFYYHVLMAQVINFPTRMSTMRESQGYYRHGATHLPLAWCSRVW